MTIRAYILCLLILSLSACGPMEPQSVEATVAITPNIKTDACAANFIRLTSNSCLLSETLAGTTGFTLTQDNTCRSFDLAAFTYPLPALSNHIVLLNVNVDVQSNNAVGEHRHSIQFFNESTCTNIGNWILPAAYEEVAVAAGTALMRTSYQITARQRNGLVYYKAIVSSGIRTANIVVYPLGYYD